MDWITIAITAAISAAASWAVQWALNYFRNNNKKAMERRQDKIKADVKAVLFEPIKTEMTDVKGGVIATLRKDITDIYKDCQIKNFRSEIDTANMLVLYRAYKKLGGNSDVEYKIKSFYELPEVYVLKDNENSENKNKEA